MINIKKKKIIHVEFNDGTQKEFPEDPTFEGEINLNHDVNGYYIKMNPLEGAGIDREPPEEIFFPYSSIKMIKEKYVSHKLPIHITKHQSSSSNKDLFCARKNHEREERREEKKKSFN